MQGLLLRSPLNTATRIALISLVLGVFWKTQKKSSGALWMLSGTLDTSPATSWDLSSLAPFFRCHLGVKKGLSVQEEGLCAAGVCMPQDSWECPLSDQHLSVVGWMWTAHLVEAEGCRGGRDAVSGCRTKFGMASEHPSRQPRTVKVLLGF
ncbi:hypothetical protein LEMLEM_LOCUS6177 [Lemmus lemmus]